MGEGHNEKTLKETILLLKRFYPNLKLALYSGRKEIQDVFYWNTFDYLKIGPYDEKAGPLNSPTTNQRMYKKVPDSEGRGIIVSDRLRFNWVDVTEKFWKR
jgi:anaerobic ribonucleoside-triphosphate reductase activating protein